jgi:hypothetical protein
MIDVNGNSGSLTIISRGLRKRHFLASAAMALGLIVMTLPATPAAAQTFSFGGFRIHVSGLEGGGYYRHRSSRHHAGTSNRRHARRHGGEQEEETAATRTPTPTPQVPAAAPVITTPTAEVPVTSASRPLLHGPDIEPSK